LVIADEQNYRYDSAVFLEAGSFQLSTDLGPNRLIATSNAACEGETVTLDAFQQGGSYIWSKDGIPTSQIPCLNCGELEVTEAGTYAVEVFLDNNCISYGEVVIEYAPIPVVQNSVLVECDVNQDGLTTYNLFDAEFDVTNNDNSSVIADFFMTEADAIANTNPITTATSFENSIPFQVVFARVINPANCASIAALELQTSNNIITIPDLKACDGNDLDGFANFNLSAIEASIINQIPTGAEVSYYETEADALSESNTLPNNYINTSINSQTIFVKIKSNNQCFSVSTANLKVLYTPILKADETVIYCLNSFPETITLYGDVVNDLPNNYYYEWFFNGSLTDVNTLFNEVNAPGSYTVVVTDPNGCSSSRTITVIPSETAIIESLSVEGVAPNNTVTINISGNGIYEFAMDDSNGFYQESPIFINIPEGFHTIYVRDRNGCGITEETISVLGFPKYFTPNGDNVNDTWNVLGFSTQFNQLEYIRIFNRYGKLITKLSNQQRAWDGSLNGRDLPSSDYWFVATFIDGKTYTGHFALKR
jgi:gliding motility-associated-like protein